jgi:GMP synthase (glutamine-hydrolysing)
MPKSAVAIRHVHFEDLGTFGPELEAAGFAIHYLDVGRDDLSLLDPLAADLLVVLGGPIGVYETEAYPFLVGEIDLIRRRLAAGRPTLGICLGAQLIATALGARVAGTGIKEIGFAPLTLSEAGARSPLRHLADVPVLHWHGDAFAIPAGAEHLAATPLCATQAFAIGRNVLGVQFHPEADAPRIESWLIGHAAELAAAEIDPAVIRRDAQVHGRALCEAGRAMIQEWIARAVES